MKLTNNQICNGNWRLKTKLCKKNLNALSVSFLAHPVNAINIITLLQKVLYSYRIYVIIFELKNIFIQVFTRFIDCNCSALFFLFNTHSGFDQFLLRLINLNTFIFYQRIFTITCITNAKSLTTLYSLLRSLNYSNHFTWT